MPEWGWIEESFIRWMPDGSQILFQMGPKVFAVDTAGSHLRMVADATWEVVVDGEVRYRTTTMTSWDVSPDGARLAFSKCGRYPPGEVDYQFLDGERRSGWVLRQSYPSGEVYGGLFSAETEKHEFEIMVSNMDGTGVERLTENGKEDNFPAWSPDGSRIAFFSGGLHTMATDGTDWLALAGGLRPRQPAWAPDGRHLAVVGTGLEEVYSVKSDGSEKFTIATDALSAPSWSPDGQRIAVAVPDGEGGAVLRTFAPDGSEPVTIARIAEADEFEVPEGPRDSWVVPNVSWSPDGSKIMYGCGRELCAVNIEDGSLVFDRLPLKLYRSNAYKPGPSDFVAAWSPDGSKIAVRLPLESMERTDGTPFLLTMDSDGTNAHVLMVLEEPAPPPNSTWSITPYCLKPVAAATSTPPFLSRIPYGQHDECK